MHKLELKNTNSNSKVKNQKNPKDAIEKKNFDNQKKSPKKSFASQCLSYAGLAQRKEKKEKKERTIFCTPAFLDAQDLTKLQTEIKERINVGNIQIVNSNGNLDISLTPVSEQKKKKQKVLEDYCYNYACNIRDQYIRIKMSQDSDYKKKILETSKIAIVIGKTGEGKSTLLNCLVDHCKTDSSSEIFKTADFIDSDSCTSQIQGEYFIFTDEIDNKPHNMYVLDTPGLDDTDIDDEFHYHLILNQILLLGYVHNFIFVRNSKNPKFTKSEQNFFNFFCDSLQNSLTSENCSLVYTHLDDDTKRKIRKSTTNFLFENFKKAYQNSTTEELEKQKKLFEEVPDLVLFDVFLQQKFVFMNSKVEKFPDGAKGFGIDSLGSNTKEVKNNILRNIVLKERIKCRDFRIKKTKPMKLRSQIKLQELEKNLVSKVEEIKKNKQKMEGNLQTMMKEIEESEKEEEELYKKIKEIDNSLLDIDVNDPEKVSSAEIEGERGFKFLLFGKKKYLEVKVPKNDFTFDSIDLDYPKTCKMKIIDGGIGMKECKAQLALSGLINFGFFKGKLTGLIEKKNYHKKKIEEMKKEKKLYWDKLLKKGDHTKSLKTQEKSTKTKQGLKIKTLIKEKKEIEKEIEVEKDEKCKDIAKFIVEKI